MIRSLFGQRMPIASRGGSSPVVLAAVLALAGALATPRTSHAQPIERTVERTKEEALALFNEARALAAQGKYKEACPKFEQAQQIDPGMGTLFNLANCYEQIGRTASAWAGFRDVAVAASAAGQVEREKVARERAAALEPKLMKLRIVVPEEAALPRLSVQRDGVDVSSLIWGTDVPVDPGRHIVTAASPGREPWSTTVDVSVPGSLTAVRVPPLAPLKATPPPPEPKLPPPQKEDARPSVVPVVVLGALTLAGAGVGIGLRVAAGGKQDEARSLRDRIGTNGGRDNTCLAVPTPVGCDDLDALTRDAATFRTIAAGAFITGGLAAAGLLTYALWPASDRSSGGGSKGAGTGAGARLTVLPAAGRASGGLLVLGTF